jgi:hypothetical protein
MVLRWTAAAMLEAAKGFRRLKGHKDLPKLLAGLRGRSGTPQLCQNSPPSTRPANQMTLRIHFVYPPVLDRATNPTVPVWNLRRARVGGLSRMISRRLLVVRRTRSIIQPPARVCVEGAARRKLPIVDQSCQ